MSLIPFEEAQSFVLGACERLAPVMAPLSEAIGLVTSGRVVATEPVPPFANTAMDGYAVRSGDVSKAAPVVLTVVGEVPAGSTGRVTVGVNEAARIMTGAPIPDGADAVVAVEESREADGGARVTVRGPVGAGDHVRRAGEDLEAGQDVFGPRTVLGPGHLGVLASLGRTAVAAYPRPRVGVLSTGDELVEGAKALRRGQIRDANRPALLALVRGAGAEPVDLGIALDNERDITGALEEGLSACDALITSGGVSVGDFDYVKAVLERMSGGCMRSMKVAIRPAKPLAFGTVSGKPVFGLPGNPVSSMVSFELFARPALRKMMGHPEIHRPRVKATAKEPLSRRVDGKTHFLRVHATADSSGSYGVELSGPQASHMLWSMALANALAVVPDGDGVPSGAAVETMLLDRG